MFKRDEVSQQEYDEVEPVDQINNKKWKPETKAKEAKNENWDHIIKRKTNVNVKPNWSWIKGRRR